MPDTELLPLRAASAFARVTDRRRLTPGEPVLVPSLGEYRVYDSAGYDAMSADALRNGHYERAIARHAPGRVALDIGTGRDLNWALACIRAGARKVFAIEELGETCHAARRRITELGMQDRIQLVEGNSTEIVLPERVDLCVSEIIGSIGSAEGAPAVLADARRRHLKPNGRMIPERCMARVEAAQLPEPLYRQPAFSFGSATYLDRVFEKVGFPFDIKVCIYNLPAGATLSDAGVFEDFDFTGDVDPDSARTVRLAIRRAGRVDGFVLKNLLWCLKDERPLDGYRDGGVFSGVVFLPVFYPGVQVAPGDEIVMICRTRPSDDGNLPDYQVEGELRRQGDTVPFAYTAAHHDPGFRRNSFYQALFPQG